MGNFLANLIARIKGNPNTTKGGLFAGAGLTAAGALVLQQAGCHFDAVQWVEVASLLFFGPAATGALATDNGTVVSNDGTVKVVS